MIGFRLHLARVIVDSVLRETVGKNQWAEFLAFPVVDHPAGFEPRDVRGR